MIVVDDGGIRRYRGRVVGVLVCSGGGLNGEGNREWRVKSRER